MGFRYGWAAAAAGFGTASAVVGLGLGLLAGSPVTMAASSATLLAAVPQTLATTPAALRPMAPTALRLSAEPVRLSPSPLSGAALAPFVGSWHVHGADLDIKADGTGTELIQLGPCQGLSGGKRCVAVASVRLVDSGGPGYVYTGFTYLDQNGAAVVPDSLEGLPQVGDGYRVEVYQPGVLRISPMNEHSGQIMGGRYRCAADASAYAHQRLCNA
ncbi:hypothetical protein Cs7R123_28170 [Catellatospora sp. TT07R-123]|uniref:hypothetical protein n=1 Tax=Catellatospora sp. TT07R-123 TaxID=2733863 RepID=UPI001B05222A|nr:hypothetical protein [Catellatospora sp. TT07R-123]GHJ45475.1 hypothetical protein Cs7R123_28170 [Catellatospora sp. TT07R-123]